MPKLKVAYTETFIKDFKKIDQQTREKIIKIINKITENPEIGKPLRYKLKNYRTIRINPYRLIYSLNGNIIYLHVFEHRKSVYKF